MKTIDAINDGLAKVERVLLFLLLIGMVGLVFSEVVVRYFVSKFSENATITGGMEFARLFMVWAGFLGASLATYEGKHLAVILKYPPKYRKFIYVGRFVLTGIFMGLVAAFGWDAFFFKKRIPTFGSAYDTSWLYLSIPLFFSIMTLRYVLLTVKSAMGQYEDPEEQTH